MAATAGKYEELEREFEDFRNTSRELEEHLEFTVEELKKEGDRLQADLDAMRAKRKRELRESADAHDQHTAHAGKLEAAAKSTREKLRVAENEVDQAERVRRRLEKEVESAREECDEKAEELCLLSGEHQVLRSAAADSARTIEHLKRELREATDEAAAKRAAGHPSQAGKEDERKVQDEGAARGELVTAVASALLGAVEVRSKWEELERRIAGEMCC